MQYGGKMSSVIVKVVVVGIEGEANLGFIARLCRNFDVDELALVNPLINPWSEEVRRYAANGAIFIDSGKMKIYSSLDDALRDVGLAACTSAVIDTDSSDILRKAIELEDFISIVPSYRSIAIVFGRESVGLTREEISKCHLLVHIAANPEYPVLNLSHAIGIVLYRLYKALNKTSLLNYVDKVDERQLEILERYIDELAYATARDERHRQLFALTFKRLVRKSITSNQEAGLLITFIRRIVRKLKLEENNNSTELNGVKICP